MIRKRAQIDSYGELPEEKRPPESMIWYGSSKDISNWFKKVFKTGKKDNTPPDTLTFNIDERDIE